MKNITDYFKDAEVYYFTYDMENETSIAHGIIKDANYFKSKDSIRYFLGRGGTYSVYFLPIKKDVIVLKGKGNEWVFPKRTKMKEIIPFIDEFKIKILDDGTLDVFLSKDIKYILKSQIEFFSTKWISKLSVDKENPYFYSPKNSNCIIRKADKKLVFGGDEINIPDEVRSIGYKALYCRKFKSLKLPENLMRIEPYAFDNCLRLENIIFNDLLMSIGKGAFLNCKELKEVTCPFNLKEIEIDAFFGCQKLTRFDFNDGIELIEQIFGKDFRIKKLIIPNTVKNVDEQLLISIESLEELTMPERLRDIVDTRCNTKLKEENIHLV